MNALFCRGVAKVMSNVVSIFLPVWTDGDCIGVRLHSVML